jgi:hypothetical protein
MTLHVADPAPSRSANLVMKNIMPPAITGVLGTSWHDAECQLMDAREAMGLEAQCFG